MPKGKQKESKNILDRPPVVAVMGHVDHGKTSLLDAIRGTNVADGEAGGITQNTRAHEIDHDGQKITFIDTPGHEAFSEMRSRGASLTDIVLLVVAADDGIQPQTKESIKFAKKSKTPIIVAINKIDLPSINTDKIKNELSQNDVLVEDYGGDVQVFEVSATKKKGLQELLEGIILQSEIIELKKAKIQQGKASAVVLEAKLDNKLGAVALVLVKSGEIKVGNVSINDEKHSKVRAILDERQSSIEIANESDPVWLVGLDEVPATGELLVITNDESEAKALIKEVKSKKLIAKQKKNADLAKISESENVDITKEEAAEQDLNELAAMLATEQQDEEIKKLNLVIRTDSQGTLEVVLNELEKLNTNEVEINVLNAGTGNITRKDVLTAKNAHGIVAGFQVTVPSDLNSIIQLEHVIVRVYSVIYEMIEELGDALEGLIEPEEVDVEVARAKVKKVFVLSDGAKVAGSEVTNGTVIKGYKVWVERGDEEIGRGRITVLKRNKDEAKEVQKGVECGIMIEPQVDVQEGDEIVSYKVEKN